MLTDGGWIVDEKIRNRSSMTQTEINNRSDHVQERVDQLERRISDIKLIPSIAISALAAMFIALTIFSGVRLEKEAKRLHDLEENLTKRVETALGKAAREPKVAPLRAIGVDLEGETIDAVYGAFEEGTMRIAFRLMLKNDGTKASDPLFLKFYSTKPLNLQSPSSDETAFDYEQYFPPEKFPIAGGVLPSGASVSLQVNLKVEAFEPLEDAYPMLAKVYDGRSLPSRAQFRIRFKKREETD